MTERDVPSHARRVRIGIMLGRGAANTATFLIVCLAMSARAADIAPLSPPSVISRIEFVGNRTTRPEIMLQEMSIKEGDIADPGAIEKSRQAIMDLGLFKAVRADLLPAFDGDVLQITVEEKVYVLPIPKVNRDAEGDIKFGVELRLDNLGGLNQRVKFSWDRRQYADSNLNNRDKIEFEYFYPRIIGTPYQFTFDLDREDTQEDVANAAGDVITYNTEVDSSRFWVARWHAKHGPSRGLNYGGGLSWSSVKYTNISGTQDVVVGEDIVALNVGASSTFVHDKQYSREGRAYGYSISIGLPGLGSDKTFTTHSLYYRGYFPVKDHEHQNLNVQLRFGFSNDPSKGAFSWGGADYLRGYDRSSFTGNAVVATNIEYLAPLFGYYPFRMLLFADIGNTYPALDEINLRDVHTGVGVGFRWKLRSFVKTDLRFDAAYATDTGETKIYVSTNETF